jgi:mono/diheme cytochrome c family protein
MSTRRLPYVSVACLIWAGCSSLTTAAEKAAQKQTAELASSAQKILSANCYKCHGADKQESGLRLDVAGDAIRGGDSGADIRPGNAKASRLIEYVGGKGETVMPPEGRRLTAGEVDKLAAWIDAGASWPTGSLNPAEDPRRTHWSFQPVRCVEPPPVRSEKWIRNEVDAFILARLERENLQPSREADRSTLIRRLSFDLTGLPPTPQEVSDFLTDTCPDAYERLVDRLLASPHFGERWARHWLDRARFAESSGCVIDLPRPFAWRWRDWVIEAINADLPFDQFTIKQIAGDLLPGATTDDRIAVGFHRNALSNHEAGIDLEAERVKTTVDRTSAVGAAWLGLTVGCAECHGHKYDPISQRDFYRLYAFFDNLDEYLIDAPPTADAQRLALAKEELKKARDEYLAATADGQAEWEAKVASQPRIWKNARDLETSSLRSSRFATLHQLNDDSLAVDGRLSSYDAYVIAFKSPVTRLSAIRVESLNDPDRFQQGPGRGSDQRAFVTGISVQVGKVDKSPPFDAPIALAESDYCQSGFCTTAALKCGESAGWSLDQIGVPHAAVFTLAQPTAVPENGRIVVRIEQYAGRGHNLLRFRVSVTDADQLTGPLVPDEIRALAERPVTERTADEQAALKRYYESVTRGDHSELAAWNAARDKFAKLAGTYAAQTVCQRTQPRDTFVHVRGDFHRPGEKVEPGLLSAFCQPAPQGQPLTRLDLAHWLVDPANPLTARVAANDCWQHLFGAGLVATPGDFGMQGEPPSHPELLDWLASQLVSSGWSRKALIRKIVTSSTYRQASVARPELAERDPKNNLLARQNRFRLEAETIRDSILAASGLLEPGIGGRGFCVNPSPDDAPADWEPQLPPPGPNDIYRRGMYAFAKRTDLDPLLVALDAPDAASSCPLRRRTNTPIQSLDLMNDAVMVAATRALASAADRNAPHELAPRMNWLFTRCLSREPSAAETKTLSTLYLATVAEYRDKLEQAAELAHVDPKSQNAAEKAAWIIVARTILNLDETVTRE